MIKRSQLRSVSAFSSKELTPVNVKDSLRFYRVQISYVVDGSKNGTESFDGMIGGYKLPDGTDSGVHTYSLNRIVFKDSGMQSSSSVIPDSSKTIYTQMALYIEDRENNKAYLADNNIQGMTADSSGKVPRGAIKFDISNNPIVRTSLDPIPTRIYNQKP